MENSLAFTHHLDDLTASLNKINAMLTVAMAVDITEFEPEITLNYLWAIDAVVGLAKDNCRCLSNELGVPT